MTDYDMVIGLLERLGIGYRTDVSSYKPDVKTIVCEQGMEKVVGYIGFFVGFDFNMAGAFIELDVGE